MVLFRALGWLLLALAMAVVVHDGLFWWSDGKFHPMTLGELWLQLDFASLRSFEGLVGHILSGAVWATLAVPALKAPALPVFVVVGLLFLWLGQGGERQAEPGFLLNARPRRRRRSRGGLS